MIRLGRKQCLVQELPAIEGLARVDVVCLDKTGTLTEGGMGVTEVRPLDGAGRAVRSRAGARRARRGRPAAQRQPRRPSSTPTRSAAAGARRGRCRSPRPASGAAPSFTTGGDGDWLLGAPDVLLPTATRRRAEAERLDAAGPAGAAAGRERPGDSTTPRRPAWSPPPALVVLEQRLRPEAGRHAALLRRAGRRGEGHLRRQRGLGRRGRREAGAARRGRTRSTPASCPTEREALADGAGDATRSSAGSPRSRSGTWSARCSPAGTRSR